MHSRKLLIRALSAAIVVVAAVSAVTVTTLSQPEVETWYFAFSQGDDIDTIVAYTADGEVNTLLEVESFGRSWRVGPQSALIEMEVDGSDILYHLTPDSAEPLTLTFDAESADMTLALVGPDDAYVAMLPSYPFTPVALVNLETNMVELLTDDILYSYICCRFSADGQYLRYYSGHRDPDATWTLWERTLATGEERAIYTWPEEQPILQADRYGDRWLYRQRVNALGVEAIANVLIHADGTVEPIDVIPAGIGRTIGWKIFKDYVIRLDLNCEADCPIELHPIAGGEPITFTMPSLTEGAFGPVHLEDGHLLARYGEEYWVLSDDGAAMRLGFTPLGAMPSPDGRWVAVAEEEDSTRYKIWDNHNQEFVLAGEVEGERLVISIAFREEGFLLNDFSASGAPSLLYRYADEAVIQLPAIEGGRHFELLADNTLLLYIRPGRDEASGDVGMTPGIYRYDPEADTYTLLLEEMYPVPMSEPYQVL